MKAGKGLHYTEESHLEGCSPTVRDVYAKLKSTFLNAGSAVEFRAVKGSIRVWIGSRRNIAEIFFRKGEGALGLECRKLAKNDTADILKHHEVTHHHERSLPLEYVKLCDTNHWGEIEKLVTRLLKRHRGVLPNLRLPSPGTSKLHWPAD